MAVGQMISSVRRTRRGSIGRRPNDFECPPGHEENQDMQRISKKIKNCEACLSEDTLCVPQRVLQQRKKTVVEAGEESRVRRGLPGPISFGLL